MCFVSVFMCVLCFEFLHITACVFSLVFSLVSMMCVQFGVSLLVIVCCDICWLGVNYTYLATQQSYKVVVVPW